MSGDTKGAIDALTDLLNKANESYYQMNHSIMTDEQFDFKLKELEALEKEFPEFKRLDSPTNKVGY